MPRTYNISESAALEQLKSLLVDYYHEPNKPFEEIQRILTDPAFNLSAVFALTVPDKKQCSLLKNEEVLIFNSLKKLPRYSPVRVMAVFVQLFVSERKTVNEKYFDKCVDRIRKRRVMGSDIFDFSWIELTPLDNTVQVLTHQAPTPSTKHQRTNCSRTKQLTSTLSKCRRRRIKDLERTLETDRKDRASLRKQLRESRISHEQKDATIERLEGQVEDLENTRYEAHINFMEVIDEIKIANEEDSNDAEKSIPHVLTRDADDSRQISADIKRAIMVLINEHGIPQTKTIGVLEAVGNIVFR